MQDKPITDIIRQVRILVPEDPISKAASLLRAAGLPELPVINYGRVVGLVRETDLVNPLSASDKGGNTAVSQVMAVEPVMVNKYMTLEQVADIFKRGDTAVLPVVDEYGAYQGVVARTDVVAFLGQVMRPATIAGMATPLGVYLTTGTVSAGAGSLGLFLTGVTLGIFIIVSSLIVYALSWLVQKFTGLPILPMLQSSPVPMPNTLDVPLYLFAVLQFGLVLLLMRLSTLSGYHAAEHMVVHALEQGEQLDMEAVRQMPRVHPRCGTNLLAGVALFLIITARFSNSVAVLVAMVILVLGWRVVGGYLQYFATTKNPNDKQLANGIKAGNELVEKYQAKPNVLADGMQRIWNIGLLQVMGGTSLVFGITYVLAEVLHLPNFLVF